MWVIIIFALSEELVSDAAACDSGADDEDFCGSWQVRRLNGANVFVGRELPVGGCGVGNGEAWITMELMG